MKYNRIKSLYQDNRERNLNQIIQGDLSRESYFNDYLHLIKNNSKRKSKNSLNNSYDEDLLLNS